MAGGTAMDGDRVQGTVLVDPECALAAIQSIGIDALHSAGVSKKGCIELPRKAVAQPATYM